MWIVLDGILSDVSSLPFHIRQLSGLPGGFGKKHRRGEMEAPSPLYPHWLDVPVARFMELRQPLAKMLILEAPKKLMHRFLDSNVFLNTMCS